MAALPVLLALPLLPMQQSHASVRYSNTQGLTFATVGEGEIRVRDYEDFDFSALNRDVDNVQRVTSRQYIDLEIPGINLAKLAEDVRGAARTLRAATADVRDNAREEGDQAIVLLRWKAIMTPERFRELRLKHNLTQELLAHILGVLVRNVQQFERLDGESSRKPNPTAC